LKVVSNSQPEIRRSGCSNRLLLIYFLIARSLKPHTMGNETLLQFAALNLDYLIIGGGTAGLVVAARLSENPEINVGIIEAGPSALSKDGNEVINVPGRYGESIGSEYDWKFHTTSQKGLGGRSLAWPRGRVLGGTSALNFMAWNRGHREDYDAWEKLGNRGWGWDDLL
jgi:choline dehydrogenase-like flavoprotein